MNASLAIAHDEQPDQIDAAPRVPAEQSPIAGLVRAMRGRWLWTAAAAVTLGAGFATLGALSGVKLYDSQAILRIYPQEANILYRTGDDSVLKTFDSFVKAETSYVASHPVMERATLGLKELFPVLAADMSADDLTGSIEIKRNDSLIVLTTKSREADFAPAKLEAVIAAYLDLKAETEAKRSAVRLGELQDREAELAARQAEIRQRTLAVGGQFGIDALTKAHVEKVAQIDALAARRAEVEATLASLRADAGTSSADMSDDEILRATLLDRGLADLNFDRAKREAELSTLQTRYRADSAVIRNKLSEIAVIDKAMADRREQIKVLGQTGALTDTSKADPQANVNEIAALLEKVTKQLEATRIEARELNGKRAELAALQEEAVDVRALLDDTRKALEIIRLEAGRALPGYSVVMSPPSRSDEPFEDSTKMNTASGLGGGVALALFLALGLGVTSGRVRYSDALTRHNHLVPVLRVLRKDQPDAPGADSLRNALQLHPLRAPRLVGATRVIAVTRPDGGAADALALGLAQSFARAHVRTLLIDADLTAPGLTARLAMTEVPGWREVLTGQAAAPQVFPPFGALTVLPAGLAEDVHAGSIGIGAIRAALGRLGLGVDLVILNVGSLRDNPASDLLISAADLAVAEVRPGDRQSAVAARVAHLDNLPRQGAVFAFTGTKAGDPGLMP
jgi:succinoglycan biosynthesis transport protein ExoP